MATIVLSGAIQGPYTFQAGNEYVGQADCRIVNNSSSDFSYCGVIDGASDVVIRGIRFTGNGIFMRRCRNIQLIDCVISEARRRQGNHQAITSGYDGNCQNILVQNCKITDCTQAAAFYNSSVSWRNCLIERCGYGIQHFGGQFSAESVLLRRIRANMGMEIFPNLTRLLIRDCAFIEPELFEDDRRNSNAMAFSTPLNLSVGDFLVERNLADGLAWLVDSSGNLTGQQRISSYGWRGLRIGFEVGGVNTVHRQNAAIRLNDPGAITTGRYNECRDNLVRDCVEQWNLAAGGSTEGLVLANNGPDVILPAQGGWKLAAENGWRAPDWFRTDQQQPAPHPDTGTIVTADPDYHYLGSDVLWSGIPVNGWGQVEVNHSVGEQKESDGRMISIRGQRYEMGLGCHAPSQIDFPLDGRYAHFAATIGIDDETNGRGSVVFEVWVDGEKKYSSGRITGTDKPIPIIIDVTGARRLTLIVTDAGDGKDFDHADWADARLLPRPAPPAETKPVVSVIADPEKVDISIMTPDEAIIRFAGE